jgi:hypothetical protein
VPPTVVTGPAVDAAAASAADVAVLLFVAVVAVVDGC